MMFHTNDRALALEFCKFKVYHRRIYIMFYFVDPIGLCGQSQGCKLNLSLG